MIDDRGPWTVDARTAPDHALTVTGPGLGRGVTLTVEADHLGVFPNADAIARVLDAI